MSICTGAPDCNAAYRLDNGTLNVQPSICVTLSGYGSLYTQLYNGILNNDLEIDLQALEQISDPVLGQAAYAAFLAKILAIFGITEGDASPRLLVAESDGTVVLDTSQTNNTWANWQSNTVNPQNHNTRVAIMDSQLFVNGVGFETKFSTTVNAPQSYIAIRAGPFRNNSGTFRLSQNILI